MAELSWTSPFLGYTFCQIPRFFFHFATGDRTVSDGEGLVFPSIVEAIEHASGVAAELGRNRADSKRQEIYVVNEAGEEVFRMPISNGSF